MTIKNENKLIFLNANINITPIITTANPMRALKSIEINSNITGKIYEFKN